MSQPVYVWSGDDYESGFCRADQIGTPKPAKALVATEVQEVQEVLEALPLPTIAELKQAALRVARGKMGYDAFLEKYPTFHQKLLLSMVKESAPPPSMQVDVNLSWLSPNRLAYKRETPLLEAVEPEPGSLSPEK